MRYLLIPLVALLLAPAPAAADWTYASGDHFEAYASGGPRQARDAIAHFERVHAFFTDFLKLKPFSGPPTRLVVFSNPREFAPYRPTAAAEAFYQAGYDRDYIVLSSLDADRLTVVVHEYAHLMFRRSGGRFPLWLDEGLAEFFSTIAPEGNRMGIGRVPLGRLLYLNDRVALMPLDRLFAVTPNSPEYTTVAHAGLFYSQSWALTHMLITDDRYRPRSGVFLDQIARGASSTAALAEAYGKSPASVSADLRNYVRREFYTLLLANYRPPPEGMAATTWSVAPFEADLMLANLLANMPGRDGDARAAFARLANARPDSVELAESRAYVELRRGRRGEALPHLARAAELGSRNAAVYRDYAMLDPSQAERVLPIAVRLAPEHVGARLSLARLQMARKLYVEAVATLEPVTPVSPEEVFPYYQMKATAYAQAGRWAAASAAAAQAVALARPGPEANMAAQLQKSIDQFAVRSALAGGVSGSTGAPSPAPPPTGGAPPPAIGAAAVEPSPVSEAVPSPRVLAVGRIVSVECGKGDPVVEVSTATQLLRLRIDDRRAVIVRGLAGPTADLTCGRHNVPIRVGYEPAAHAALATVGNLRLLDYRPSDPEPSR
jgi:tetratricopeptide (TPR) repeat protein